MLPDYKSLPQFPDLSIKARHILSTTTPQPTTKEYDDLLQFFITVYAIEQRIPSITSILFDLFEDRTAIQKLLLTSLTQPSPQPLRLIATKLCIYTLIKVDNPTAEWFYINALDISCRNNLISRSSELRCETTRLFSILFSPSQHQPQQSTRLNPLIISKDTIDLIRINLLNILSHPSELLLAQTLLLFSLISTHPHLNDTLLSATMKYHRSALKKNSPSFNAYKSFLLQSKLQTYDRSLSQRQRPNLNQHSTTTTPATTQQQKQQQQQQQHQLPLYIQTPPSPLSSHYYPTIHSDFAAINVQTESVLAYIVRFLHPQNSPYLHLTVLKLINSIITNPSNHSLLFHPNEPEHSPLAESKPKPKLFKWLWWFQLLFFPSFLTMQQLLHHKLQHIDPSSISPESTPGQVFPLINEENDDSVNDATDDEYSPLIDTSDLPQSTSHPISTHDSDQPTWKRAHRHYKKSLDLKGTPYGLSYFLSTTTSADILIQTCTLIYNILSRLPLKQILEVIPVQLIAEQAIRKLHSYLLQTYSRIDSVQVITPQVENCIQALWLVLLACARFPATQLIDPSLLTNPFYFTSENPRIQTETISSIYLNIFAQFPYRSQPQQVNQIHAMLLDCIMLSTSRIVDVVISETLDQTDLLDRTGLANNIPPAPTPPVLPSSKAQPDRHLEQAYLEAKHDHIEAIRAQLRQAVVLLVNKANEDGSFRSDKNSEKQLPGGDSSSEQLTNGGNGREQRRGGRNAACTFTISDQTRPACANLASLVCAMLFYQGYYLVLDQATLHKATLHQQHQHQHQHQQPMQDSIQFQLSPADVKKGLRASKQPNPIIQNTIQMTQLPPIQPQIGGNLDQLVMLGGSANGTSLLHATTKSAAAVVSIPKEFTNPIQTTLGYLDYIAQTDYSNPPLHHTSPPPIPFTPQQLEKSRDYSTFVQNAGQSQLTSHYDAQRGASKGTDSRSCNYLANINCLYDCLLCFVTTPPVLPKKQEFFAAGDRIDTFSQCKLYLLVNHIRQRFILPTVSPKTIQEYFYKQLVTLRSLNDPSEHIQQIAALFDNYIQQNFPPTGPSHVHSGANKSLNNKSTTREKNKSNNESMRIATTTDTLTDTLQHRVPGIPSEQYELFNNIHACPSCSQSYRYLSPLSNLDYSSPSSLASLPHIPVGTFVQDEPGNVNIISDIFQSTGQLFNEYLAPNTSAIEAAQHRQRQVAHLAKRFENREFPEFSMGMLFLPKAVNIVFSRFFALNALSPATIGDTEPSDPLELAQLAMKQTHASNAMTDQPQKSTTPVTAFTITPLIDPQSLTIKQIQIARDNLFKNEDDASALVQWFMQLLMYWRLIHTRLQLSKNLLDQRRRYYLQIDTRMQKFQQDQFDGEFVANFFQQLSPLFDLLRNADRYNQLCQTPSPLDLPQIAPGLDAQKIEAELRIAFSELLSSYTTQLLPSLISHVQRGLEAKRVTDDLAQAQSKQHPNLQTNHTNCLKALEVARSQYEQHAATFKQKFIDMYVKFRPIFINAVGGDEALRSLFDFSAYDSRNGNTNPVPAARQEEDNTSRLRFDPSKPFHLNRLPSTLQPRRYPETSLTHLFVSILAKNPFVESISKSTLSPSHQTNSSHPNPYINQTLDMALQLISTMHSNKDATESYATIQAQQILRIERYSKITSWATLYTWYLDDAYYIITRALKQSVSMANALTLPNEQVLQYILQNKDTDLSQGISKQQSMLLFPYKHFVSRFVDKNLIYQLNRASADARTHYAQLHAEAAKRQ